MNNPNRMPNNRIVGPDPARDVDDELSFHIDMRIAELIAAGEDPDRARALTMERLGDITAPRAECLVINERKGRAVARADHLNELRQDTVYALRSLRRRPAFSIVAILTLALGIGANSAIFSVVYGVLLQPLAFRDGDRLAVVETEYRDGDVFPLSAPDFMSVQKDSKVYEAMAAHDTRPIAMTGQGEPREVERTRVSKGFFSVLGVSPIAGRTFADAEHVPGGQRIAVLTEGLAKNLFGGARVALNRTITLAGTPYTVVGVMPRGTEFPERSELYTPILYDSTYNADGTISRRSESLNVVARMRPGIMGGAAELDAKRVGKALQARFPNSNGAVTMRATPLVEKLTGSVRQPLLVLLGSVALVLLIACANVANLVMARATTREGELAVRAALGAGRGRLVRQMLTEAVVLSMTGAVVGLLLAWWGTHALTAAQPADIPRLTKIGINRYVIGFTALLSVATGLMFGALPAFQATGSRLMQSLREGGRGALSGARGQRIRAAFVVAELALAVVLLTGAGLLIRSFLELTHVEPGFRPDNAVAFKISLQDKRYPDANTRIQFFHQLEERLHQLPGVTEVGGATGLPMTGMASLIGPFQAVGRDVPEGMISEIRWITTTPGYIDAIGVKLLMGRKLDGRDRADAPLTGIVNRAAIKQWFPDGDPVGERVDVGGTEIEIVGVIDNMLQHSPDQPIESEMYVPYEQNVTPTQRIVVRGSNVMSLAPRIRAEVHALDAQIPLDKIEPLSKVVDDALARPRFYTSLMVMFAGIAIALAVVGIFGVMNYLVAQRSREISVRMALGADRVRVVWMVVGSAMRVAALGLIIGLAAAFAFTRVLQTQLFGVGATDPVTLITVLALLSGSAGVASFLPARRASRLDPGAALREG